MIDVLGMALVLVAVSLLIDSALPRAALIGTAVWALGCIPLIVGHGLFPGVSYGLATLTAGLSVAILAAPLAPRVLLVLRGTAGTAAIAAAIMYVPSSIRSGQFANVTGRSSPTPCTVIVPVPSPSS